MAQYTNARSWSVELSGGRMLPPGQTANIDPTIAHNLALITAQDLVLLDPSTPPENPDDLYARVPRRVFAAGSGSDAVPTANRGGDIILGGDGVDRRVNAAGVPSVFRSVVSTTQANEFTATQTFDPTEGIAIGDATFDLDTVYDIERLFVRGKPIRGNTVGNWFGTGGDGASNGLQTTHVGLHATLQHPNPTEVIMQHFVGYSFYPVAGNVGGEVGTLQGGSSESHVYADGRVVTPAVLGFEMLGRATGANSGDYTTVIAGQNTAIVDGTVSVENLIGHRVSAVRHDGSGSPTVDKSVGLQIKAPTVGTLRRSMEVEGLTYLIPLVDNDELITLNSSAGTKRMSLTHTVLKGLASDGTSQRFLLDSRVTASYVAHFTATDAATVGLRVDTVHGTPTANLFEVYDASNVRFRVTSAGVAVASAGLTVAGGITVNSGTLSCVALTSTGALAHQGSTFGVFNKSPSAQRSKINDPSGGATVDAESRTAIASIIDALEAFGFSALA